MAVLTEEIVDGVAVLTLRRPDQLNALTEEMIGLIEGALDRHETSDSIALVFTGEGRAFCAGSDLKEPPKDVEARLRRMHRLALRLIEYPKLSVAAMNGMALGGGLELALGCTFRIATPTAQLGVPEVKLSTMPGYGGAAMLPRVVGEVRALEMLVTGDPVSGEEARRIGLVTALDEDPVGAAIRFAQRCTRYGQPVQRAARRISRESPRLPLWEALELERELNTVLARSPECQAAIRAFAERSKAKRS